MFHIHLSGGVTAGFVTPDSQSLTFLTLTLPAGFAAFRRQTRGQRPDCSGEPPPKALHSRHAFGETGCARKRALPGRAATAPDGQWRSGLLDPKAYRSEEHTSELQSLRHLVCRLL